MGNQIDIQTLQNQLNYLGETKEILKTTLQSKGVKVSDETPFRDYATELESLPNIKLYDTLEELETDTAVTNDLLGIVYKNGGRRVTFTEEFEGPIVLPKTIELDMTIAELRNIVGNSEHTYVSNTKSGDFSEYQIVDEDDNVIVGGHFSSSVYVSGANAGKIQYYDFFITKSAIGQVRYTGDPYGSVYTRNDSEIGFKTIGGEKGKKYRFKVVKDYYGRNTHPRVADMFRAGEVNFDGMYKFDGKTNAWVLAPTDLIATSKDVWDNRYYGADGIHTGTLNSPTYITDETKSDVKDLYSKYLGLFKHIDTTNITNYFRFYNMYCNNAQFLPFIKVGENTTNCSAMFENAYSLLSADLNGWNTINVVNMSKTFSNASNLRYGNHVTSSWNTSNVTDMSYAFSNTYVLPSLTNTVNLVNASGMFFRHKSVSSVSIPNMNNITNMSKMYENCFNLNSVVTYTWKPVNVTDMSFMFSNCYNARINTSAISGNFNTPNVTNCAYMFHECRNLGYLNLPANWMSNSTNHAYMFYNCTAMSSFDSGRQVAVGNSLNTAYMFYKSGFSCNKCPVDFQYKGVTVNMSHMFDGCKLQTTSWGQWNCVNVSDVSYIFANTPSIKNLYGFSWDMPKVKSLTGIIQGSVLNQLNIFRGRFDSLTSIGGLVSGANSLKSLIFQDTTFNALTSLNISSASALQTIRFANTTFPVINSIKFMHMPNLTTLTGFNTLNIDGVTDFTQGFRNCSSLTTVTFNNKFTGENVTRIFEMFMGCTSLADVSIANWNMASLTDMYGLFRQCNSLIRINLSNWVCPNLVQMPYAFCQCQNLLEVNLANLDTSNVRDFSQLFIADTNLQNINANLKITGSANCYAMFQNCSNLTTINAYNWTFASTANLREVFAGCSNLQEIVGMNTWDMSNNPYCYQMFRGCYNIQNWDVGNWYINNSYLGANIFDYSGFNNLSAIKGWNFANLTNSAYSFGNCYYLKGHQDLSNVEFPKLTYARYMFKSCTNLESIDLSNWNAPLLNNITQIFDYCPNLRVVNMSNWNAPMVNNFYSFFEGKYNIEEFDISGWNYSNITNLGRMFAYCNKISDATIDQFINMAIASNVPTGSRNLMVNYTYSPFVGSNITNDRYITRHDELTNAGWSF